MADENRKTNHSFWVINVHYTISDRFLSNVQLKIHFIVTYFPGRFTLYLCFAAEHSCTLTNSHLFAAHYLLWPSYLNSPSPTHCVWVFRRKQLSVKMEVIFLAIKLVLLCQTVYFAKRFWCNQLLCGIPSFELLSKSGDRNAPP